MRLCYQELCEVTSEPEAPIEMVRVGRDAYMSREDAYAKGYVERLSPPRKGEPILAAGWLTSVIVLAGSIGVGLMISPAIKSFAHATVQGAAKSVGFR